MNESIIKTLAVAFSVCLVCSLIVSASAVSLRDLQKENKLNDKRLKVLQVAGIYDQNISISDQFNQLESKFIDFDSGMLMAEYNNFNIDEYDQVVITKNPALSSEVPASEDIAIIKNRENVGKIYILRDDLDNIEKLIREDKYNQKKTVGDTDGYKDFIHKILGKTINDGNYNENKNTYEYELTKEDTQNLMYNISIIHYLIELKNLRLKKLNLILIKIMYY